MGTLNQTELRALLIEVQTGKDIADNFPEVADMYRSGMTHNQIVDGLKLRDYYPYMGREIIRASVGFAIRGYKGGGGIEPYEGLISDRSELKRITLEHRVSGGQKIRKEGKGLFSLSKQRKRNVGLRSLKDKKGIHGKSSKDLREYSLKGLAAQGYTPLAEGEARCAYELSQEEKYIHKKGRSMGRPMWGEIASALNKKFHKGKTIRVAQGAIQASRKYSKELDK